MGKFTEYKLPLKSMTAGTHHYEYHLDKVFFTNMESEDVRDADLSVNLTITAKGDLYVLNFKITGNVTLLCDRCLDDLEHPIDATYSINVKYGDDYNDDSDELLIIPENDNYLNVAYLMYDTVALAIPIKHVHQPGKCNRQMSAMLKKHRSRNENDEDLDLEESLIEEMDSIEESDDNRMTDPRWDALKNLSNKGPEV